MSNGPQTLSFKSFGMCTECYAFQRDHPVEATENEVAYFHRQRKKKEEEEEAFKAHRWRVWVFEPNEKLPNAPFATAVTGVKFTKYPSPTPKDGLANYTVPFLTEEDAIRVVDILKSKNLTCWYGEIIRHE